ncbi:MAG: OmpA family protein [Azonexus sp.]|jgi:outer membrane protein OmpA-like peptidoglycan-associated protein
MRIDWPLIIVAGLLLGGCVSERVVLLPSPDDRPTAVVVRDARGEVVLDKPYAGVQRRAGEISPVQSSPAEVDKWFGAALAAQPLKPRSFTLYFAGGAEMLRPESEAELATIKREIAGRPASEVMVIGHTDTVGGLEANDKLSLKRATAVREILIAAGVPGEKIETAGRGEREPLVKTGDEVAEPQNRRVEISVR